MRDLTTVLDRWRRDAEALRRNGEPAKADLLDRCADEVRATAGDYLRFVDEAEAATRTGRSRDWLRTQFRAWQPHGHARQVGRDRLYRLCVLPLRPALVAAGEDGRRAARMQRVG